MLALVAALVLTQASRSHRSYTLSSLPLHPGIRLLSRQRGGSSTPAARGRRARGASPQELTPASRHASTSAAEGGSVSTPCTSLLLRQALLSSRILGPIGLRRAASGPLDGDAALVKESVRGLAHFESARVAGDYDWDRRLLFAEHHRVTPRARSSLAFDEERCHHGRCLRVGDAPWGSGAQSPWRSEEIHFRTPCRLYSAFTYYTG